MAFSSSLESRLLMSLSFGLASCLLLLLGLLLGLESRLLLSVFSILNYQTAAEAIVISAHCAEAIVISVHCAEAIVVSVHCAEAIVISVHCAEAIVISVHRAHCFVNGALRPHNRSFAHRSFPCNFFIVGLHDVKRVKKDAKHK
jgi:hypothetical protein